MKPNRLIRLLATGAFSAIALTTAFAQVSTTTTTSDGVTTSSVRTIDSTGTIAAYSPGSDYITVRAASAAEPVKYYYTKETSIVDPEGRRVEWSMLRPDMPVKYTYVKEGDRMVVRKITLDKPIAYYEKTTTTTTTTQP